MCKLAHVIRYTVQSQNGQPYVKLSAVLSI